MRIKTASEIEQFYMLVFRNCEVILVVAVESEMLSVNTAVKVLALPHQSPNPGLAEPPVPELQRNK